MADLPTHTVTFLFTDIEGSTRLWERHPETMRVALPRHDAILTEGIERHGGVVVKSRGEGDSFFAVFAQATDAVAAAVDLQRVLRAEPWDPRLPLRVRMAVHTGQAELRGRDYYGPAVNRCARLRAAAHGGQILLSRATQELAADHLPEGVSLRDLGECRLKDLVRPEHVFQLLHPKLPVDFPPLQSLATRPNNLPAQPTPLIGREVEQAALRRLLGREQVRLVTLTGPGGTGKTRLALQVAAGLLDEFADGVFFVDLAPIREPERVVDAITQVLGVREAEGRPLRESLKEYLREKQLLLLLDNFEQVLAAAPLVAELLAAAARLKVLVTSRAILRLRGEHDFPVPPLALPDRGHVPQREQLSQYAAVALFIQRAVAARPDFAITNENASVVVEICQWLDGLPLAIELAAARVRLLSPEALRSRLENRLKLLTIGPRDLPARQQTLRNAISWSYDLLQQGEQSIFRRLSVFVGGFSPEATETVCDASGDLGIEVLEGVASLVDKSLIQQDEAVGGEPRWKMLETLREYGLECLEASGEAITVRRRHANYYLALAEEAGRGLTGRDQTASLEQLERDHENLRAALDWLEQQGEIELCLRFGAALWRYWQARGYLGEGRECLMIILALSGESEFEVARAEVLHGAGLLAYDQSDYKTAWVVTKECLEIRRRLGNQRGIAASLNNLGHVARVEGDYALARPLYAESLAIGRELGDQESIIISLSGLGLVRCYQGDYVTARRLFEESLVIGRDRDDRRRISIALKNLGLLAHEIGDYAAASSHLRESLIIAQELGDQLGIARALQGLGSVALQQGDYLAAQALLEESLVIQRKHGDRHGIAGSLHKLGTVAHAQGNCGAGRSLRVESLAIRRELGDRPGLAEGLEGLAMVSQTQGRPEQVALLFGAAEALREAIGAPIPPSQSGDYEREVATVRAVLDGEAFAAAWAAGRALSLEEAIGCALEEANG